MCASSSTRTTCGLRARIASTSISSNIVPLYSIFLRGTVSSWETSSHYALSSVRFNDADHHIFAARVPANSFAQHAVSLPDARRIAEEKLEDALLLFGLGDAPRATLRVVWALLCSAPRVLGKLG